jgi:hypothetical protein
LAKSAVPARSVIQRREACRVTQADTAALLRVSGFNPDLRPSK